MKTMDGVEDSEYGNEESENGDGRKPMGEEESLTRCGVAKSPKL